MNIPAELQAILARLKDIEETYPINDVQIARAHVQLQSLRLQIAALEVLGQYEVDPHILDMEAEWKE